ncbi:hypothetical protein PINS_up019851 [Pythium insidiosum]|nr:hypothetical protein PINS_up019851 [Pythium insidiosum]
MATWFTKRELALALGVSGSFAGLGGILNNILTPYFADRFNVSLALCFATLICAMSVAVWASIVPFHTVAGSLLLERDFFRAPPPQCTRCGEGNYASYSDCREIVPSCPPFPPYAWPIPKLSETCDIQRGIDQLYCSTTPPYIRDSAINCDDPVWKNGPITALYCSKKVIAEEKASRVMALPPLITLVASPVLGYAFGNAPQRGILASGACLVIVVTQLGVAVTRLSIWLLVLAQGIASCLFFSVIWPSIPCTY